MSYLIEFDLLIPNWYMKKSKNPPSGRIPTISDIDFKIKWLWSELTLKIRLWLTCSNLSSINHSSKKKLFKKNSKIFSRKVLTSEVRQISILDSKQRALNLHISLLHAHWPIVFFHSNSVREFFSRLSFILLILFVKNPNFFGPKFSDQTFWTRLTDF